MSWPLDPPPPGAQLEGMYIKILKNLNDKAAGPSTDTGGAAESTAPNSTSAPSTAAIKGA